MQGDIKGDGGQHATANGCPSTDISISDVFNAGAIFYATVNGYREAGGDTGGRWIGNTGYNTGSG